MSTGREPLRSSSSSSEQLGGVNRGTPGSGSGEHKKSGEKGGVKGGRSKGNRNRNSKLTTLLNPEGGWKI